jgi:predicted TPR repeat methyltransferase
MSTLYTNLAEVYEAMYNSFINYTEEFDFYNNFLKNYNCTSVLEVGCGTGHLGAAFNEAGIDYTGLDLSEDMLQIAKTNHPQCRFIQADVRNFELDKKLEATIITGRTISYLVKNTDVLDAFASINKNMLPSGLLCFDCINANHFMPLIKNGLHTTHIAAFKNKNYSRDSYWQTALAQQGFCFNWQAVYYEENKNGGLDKIGEDESVIRTFCKDEIILLLELTGFGIKEIIARPSYAFDTFVIVAEKM